MITSLIDNVREVALSAQSETPLCLSVQDLDAAQVKPYVEALNTSTIVLDAPSATHLLALSARHTLGVSYVENFVRNSILRARRAHMQMVAA